jgi:Glycosyltransferase Family 4
MLTCSRLGYWMMISLFIIILVEESLPADVILVPKIVVLAAYFVSIKQHVTSVGRCRCIHPKDKKTKLIAYQRLSLLFNKDKVLKVPAVATVSTLSLEINDGNITGTTTDNNNNNNNIDNSGYSEAVNKKDNILQQPEQTTTYKICLMVEPTPFAYVCGYANRFKEMLHYMKIANDNVCILTTPDYTPPDKNKNNNDNDNDKEKRKQMQQLEQYEGYNITYTKGFGTPFYKQMRISFDIPDFKGIQLIRSNQPDIIHVTSPGILLFAAIFYSRYFKIPLIMSYHTHLPMYGMYILCLFVDVDQSFFLYLMCQN